MRFRIQLISLVLCLCGPIGLRAANLYTPVSQDLAMSWQELVASSNIGNETLKKKKLIDLQRKFYKHNFSSMPLIGAELISLSLSENDPEKKAGLLSSAKEFTGEDSSYFYQQIRPQGFSPSYIVLFVQGLLAQSRDFLELFPLLSNIGMTLFFSLLISIFMFSLWAYIHPTDQQTSIWTYVFPKIDSITASALNLFLFVVCGLSLGALGILLFAVTASILYLPSSLKKMLSSFFFILLFSASLFVLPSIVQTIHQDPPVDSVALAQGRLTEENIQRLQNLNLKSPENIKSRFSVGTLALQALKLDVAQSHFETILNQNPRFTPAKINLAITQHKMGLTDEAIQTLSDAIAVNNESSLAHFNLSKLYSATAQVELARKHLDLAKRVNPDRFSTLAQQSKKPTFFSPLISAQTSGSAMEYLSDRGTSIAQRAFHLIGSVFPGFGGYSFFLVLLSLAIVSVVFTFYTPAWADALKDRELEGEDAMSFQDALNLASKKKSSNLPSFLILIVPGLRDFQEESFGRSFAFLFVFVFLLTPFFISSFYAHPTLHTQLHHLRIWTGLHILSLLLFLTFHAIRSLKTS